MFANSIVQCVDVKNIPVYVYIVQYTYYVFALIVYLATETLCELDLRAKRAVTMRQREPEFSPLSHNAHHHRIHQVCDPTPALKTRPCFH